MPNANGACKNRQLPDVTIDFQQESHIYTLNKILLPSVTQIMEPMSLMLYKDVPQDVLYGAANRGTRAHEQVSNYVKYGIDEQDEDTAPYITAFRAFERAYNPVWADSEYRTYHKALRYAGTLDLIGFVQSDDGTGYDLVDIKCTSVFHGIMLATQLAGYEQALESHGVNIRACYGLQLEKTEKFRFERVDVRDGFKVFLHCLAIYNAMASERKP